MSYAVSHHSVFRQSDDGKEIEEAVFFIYNGEADVIPYATYSFNRSIPLVWEGERRGLIWHFEGIPFQHFDKEGNK